MVPGYCYSESSRKKQGDYRRKAFLGANNPHAKPVVCEETGEIFPTAREASKTLGVSRGAVANCVRNAQKTCKGYHWREATEEEFPRKKPKPKGHKPTVCPTARPVYCVELDKIFPSVIAASRELHCSQCAINYAASGKVKNPRRYHWKYVDEANGKEEQD